MPAPVQVAGSPYARTAGGSTAGTLYPAWPRPAAVMGGGRIVTAVAPPAPPPGGIELLVDQAWTTGTDTSLACSAFDAPAGSLIILEAHLDSTAASPPATTVNDSAGLTWTMLGTPQRGASGGYSAAWWAYAVTARTAVTASVNWSSSLANKTIKPQVWAGADPSTPVISKTQGTSTTPSLTVNVTTTNHGCRIGGTAVDWNAPGTPTSTDDELAYFISTRIDGISVHKAVNSSGVGSTVGLHMATAGLATPDWAYKVWEIVPAPAGAGGSVSGDSTLAVTTTVTTASQLDTVSSSTLAATTTVTAAGVRGAVTDTALTATTSVLAAGTLGLTATATVAASTTITAAGAVGAAPILGDATLAVTTLLAATGRLGAVAGASLAASTTVATAGVRGQPGTTTLAASTTVTTAGVRGTVSGSTLAASTTVTTAGATVGLGSTTLPVTTTLTTVGATGSVAGLTVATTITTAATRATVGVGTLAVVTTLTAVGRLGARATSTVGVVTTVAAVAFLTARSSISIMVVTVVGVEGTAAGPLSVLVAGTLTVIGEPDASLMTTLPSSATVIGDSLSQAVVGEARHPLEVV